MDRMCDPPYSHIFLDGAWVCACGACDHRAAQEALTHDETKLVLRIFESLMGEARN